jgi:hypothetical protein
VHAGADDVVVVHRRGSVDDYIVSQLGASVHHRSVHDQDAAAHRYAWSNVSTRADGIHQGEATFPRTSSLTLASGIVTNRDKGIRIPGIDQSIEINGLIQHRNSQDRVARPDVQAGHDILSRAPENVDNYLRMSTPAEDEDRIRIRQN